MVIKGIPKREICERLPKNGWTVKTKTHHVDRKNGDLPAPSLNELWEALPMGVMLTKLEKTYRADYKLAEFSDTIGYFKIADTPEDTLALMWLLINGEYSEVNAKAGRSHEA